ncbi:MAG: ATP-grasp domain-containing protein [Puniceicoccaceae bacterium]
MKDKVAFREALAALFPSFWFNQVGISELPRQKLDPEKSYVIKPVKGCFGSGVRVIQGDADLGKLGEEISIELKKNSSVFSDSVLSSADMIIEECVEGEEYAVDMFYNQEGKPVITNIYYHPMPRNPAYLHMIYCTSSDIFSTIYPKAVRFFERFQQIVPVTNIPIHAEFRLQNDQLVPVEMNSLRFGGMGLTNLSYYGFGSNAYQFFIDDTEPDWSEIWRKRPETTYAFFIAYNGVNTNPTTHQPDWDSFRRIFTNIIHEVSFDYQKQLAFGVLYIEGTNDHILSLLGTEFDEHFVPVS